MLLKNVLITLFIECAVAEVHEGGVRLGAPGVKQMYLKGGEKMYSSLPLPLCFSFILFGTSLNPGVSKGQQRGLGLGPKVIQLACSLRTGWRLCGDRSHPFPFSVFTSHLVLLL